MEGMVLDEMDEATFNESAFHFFFFTSIALVDSG
jgi:hypothetical protein